MNKSFFARLSELFEDPDGKLSNGRLNRSFVIYTALTTILIAQVHGTPVDYTLVALLLGYGFVTEATTKAIESKNRPNIPTNVA